MFFPDDFFSRAIIAGLGVAIVAGPLGCFVLWQRLSFLGDTMAHSALLGIAIGLALNINILIGVFFTCAAIALVLARVNRRSILSGDAALGIMSHATLAIGLVVVSLMYWIRIDVLDFLFGNILAVSWSDIALIYLTGAVTLAVILWRWNALVSLTVSEQIAAAEGLRPFQTRNILMILLAAVIAVAMKVVGIILAVSLLIIPAATARQLAGTPEQMAVLASVAGVVSVLGGLLLSLEYDTPPGPSIVVVSFALFVAVMGLLRVTRKQHDAPQDTESQSASDAGAMK